jgi:predicted MFS family arabinose efflux permease
MIHHSVQLKATGVAPDACGAAVALYAPAWATGQATGAAAMGPTVALSGGAPTLAAFGLGLGLRSNLQRFRP